MKKMIKTKYYYDLIDLCVTIHPYSNELDYLEIMSEIYNLQIDNENVTEYTKKLFNVIFSRFGTETVLVSYEDLITGSSIVDSIKAQNLVAQINGWLTRSRFKYETRLKLWQNNANDLMKPVETVNRVADNDAPQSVNPIEDEHSSFISIQSSNQDGNTVANRLAEVDNNIREIYTEWSDDFSDLFCIEESEESENDD